MKYPKLITSNTLVDYPRLDVIVESLNKTKYVPGEVAEVGVYKGGTAGLIQLYKPTNKHLYLFDTFTGMPKANEKLDLHKEGDFNDTSIEHIDFLVSTYSQSYSIYKGVFPRENTEYVKHLTFSFVHLDVDIYDSIKECLEFFYPRMRPNSIILLDDYNEPNCPGAKLAADEFAKANNIIIEPTVQSQAIINIK